MAEERPREEVEAEIEETLGLVPNFFGRIPDALIDRFWQDFRHFELGEPDDPLSGTQFPALQRQLMGVTLHSETKCEYCTFLHIEVAKFLGATDEQIQEALQCIPATLSA